MPAKILTAPATEPLSLSDALAHLRIDTGNLEPAPAAPIAALAGAGAGNVDNGAHRYAVTFVTAAGETQAGIVSAAVTVVDKAVNGRISLTAIPLGGVAVTSRKLYRTVAAGTTYLLLATLADNTTTTYTDNIADASLGAGAPSTNTTGNSEIASLITDARRAAEGILDRALITQTWELTLDRFPFYSADNTRSEILLPRPPLQSVTSITYTDIDGATQTLASANYKVDTIGEPGRVVPAYGLSWPSTRNEINAVTVRYVCGYGAAATVPADIVRWMKTFMTTAHETRGTTSDVVAELKYIHGLLDPYRQFGFR